MRLDRYRNPYNPINRAIMAGRLAYLRWRMRAARDEMAQLLQVWDWIPEQLKHHRTQVQRWDRQAQRLEAELLHAAPTKPTRPTRHTPQASNNAAGVATTITPSDWAALR